MFYVLYSSIMNNEITSITSLTGQGDTFPSRYSSPSAGKREGIMKSLIKSISKKNAEILLRALRHYSQTYYQYKDGRDYYEGNLTANECDSLMELTKDLAEKIGLDSEAGY